MSRHTLVKTGAPSVPAVGKYSYFVDSADGKLKAKDGDTGQVYSLSHDEYPKNELINGGFGFAARQVPGTLTTYNNAAARAYGADRWGMTNQTASLQYQQVDSIAAPEAGLQHRYYGRFKQITGAGKFVVSQVMTGENCAPYRGRVVRFQVKMKRTVAAAMTVRIGLAQLTAAGTVDVVPGYAAGVPSGTFVSAFNANGTDPTLGTNLAYIAPIAGTQDGGTIAGNGMNCVLSGAWVRYSVCFTCPTDYKNLVVLVWTDGQPAALDELNVAEAGFYDGADIVDWIAQPQVSELNRCWRFYQKSFPLATVPAQNAGLAGAWRGGAANAGAVAIVHGFIQFVTWMRAAPTIVLFNPAAANAFLRYIITPSDATATSATQVTERGTEVTATGLAAWIAGGGVAVHYTADAEI